MTTYSIRITYALLDDTSYNEAVRLVQNDADRYYLVSEIGSKTNKPHLQGWIDIGDRKIGTVRKHIREYVKNHNTDKKSGNEYFSVKQCDEEIPSKLLAYFMKEDQTPISNLTDNELSEAIALQEQFIIDQKAKKEERKNNTMYKWCTNRIHEMRVNLPDKYQDDMRLYWDEEEGSAMSFTKKVIVDVVLSYYEYHEKSMNRGYIISLCSTLCYKYVPSYKVYYRRDILDQIDLQ